VRDKIYDLLEKKADSYTAAETTNSEYFMFGNTAIRVSDHTSNKMSTNTPDKVHILVPLNGRYYTLLWMFQTQLVTYTDIKSLCRIFAMFSKVMAKYPPQSSAAAQKNLHKWMGFKRPTRIKKFSEYFNVDTFFLNDQQKKVLDDTFNRQRKVSEDCLKDKLEAMFNKYKELVPEYEGSDVLREP